MIPRLAVHYVPILSISGMTALQIRQSLEAHATANQGFPTPFMSDEVTFVIDTGASITVTHCKADFLSTPRPVQPTKLQGIAAGLEVKGIGDAEYLFKTDMNETVSIVLQNVLYVPACNIRLLCPRHLAECTKRPTDGCNSIRDVGILTCHGQCITVPYHISTASPIITTVAGLLSYTDFCAAFTMPSTSYPPINTNFQASPARMKQNLTSYDISRLLFCHNCTEWGTQSALGVKVKKTTPC
jgi:hypothetical protein